MHTRSSFLVAKPEFTETDAAVVDAALASAQRRMDADVWGDLENDGHAELTAHLLANNPMGNGAKLVAKSAKDARTVYEAEYLRLVGIVSCGIRSI